MNGLFRSSLFCLGFSVACTGFSQSWSTECADLASTAPFYSDDYGISRLGNNFIGISTGLSGNARWDSLSCYPGGRGNLDASGRFALWNGPIGSIQTPFDNNLALTTGAPRDPVGDYCFTRITKDKGAGSANKSTVIFGEGGFGYFVGASNRYFEMNWSDADCQVILETRVIADALRMRYRIFNRTQTSMKLGLKFGASIGMRSGGDNQGFNQSNSLLGTNTGNPRVSNDPIPYIGYIELPTVRPVRTERNYIRGNPRFPDYVNFQWSQQQPYGFRYDLVPTDATPDATPVEGLLLSSHRVAMWERNMRSRVFTDPYATDPVLEDAADLVGQPVREDSDTTMGDPCFIASYEAETVAPNSFRDIVVYVRSPWGLADYLDPYSVVIDAPRIVETTPGQGTNDLTPNPMTIAAYLDNQYATLDREVPLSNVRARISFPAGSGLRLADGESAEKTIARIDPNEIASLDWQVVADGEQIGYQPYTITFSPTPGPTKTLSGTVLVSATPKVRLAEGPNLVTVPWDFNDTSLDAIFGPIGDPNALKLGRDYLAYQWDPAQNQYVPITSAVRGSAIWILPLADQGFRDLNGALVPPDQATGGVTTTLQPGWNMIGNPYTIPVPISQLIGVGEDDPTQSLTWRELVDNGWVSGSLAYWKRSSDDPTSGSYLFTGGDTDLLLPQTGYWVYVSTLRPIRVSWPPIFAPGLSSANRSANAAQVWKQTDRQWRLQMIARTSNGVDSGNYVGLAANATEANRRRIYEPPAAPDSSVELSIRETVNGKPTRLAQSLADRMGRKTWTVVAKAKEAGDVTITWPNINSIPRNVRMTITDASSNTTRDLRFSSSYTFRMDQAGSREFQVTMEPGGAQRAVIGNVSVARPSRSPNAGLSITYTLSSDAVTTVRILSGAGKEVYTVTRGRAVSAGARTDTWNLRDKANRAVAPGAYQVEIVAETANGERVRRVVPVNITR